MTVGEPRNPHSPSLPYFPCTPLSARDIPHAPVVFRNRVVLPCTPVQLFQILEDAEAWHAWTLGIRHVAWTSAPPFGPGTTRTVTFWGGTEVYERFDNWKTGEEMSFHFEGTSQEIWRSFGERYLVSAKPRGRCELEWTVGYEPASTFARLHPWIRPAMAANLSMYMVWLRRYCARNFSPST